MPSSPPDHVPTAPQQDYSISSLLNFLGLVVKLPLTFIRWSYQEIAPATLHSFTEGSCPNQQGPAPHPVISDSWTVLRKGPIEYTNYFSQSLFADFYSSIDSSLDPSMGRHTVGDSQSSSTPDLTKQVVRREIYPTLSGTYSDVWLSTWHHGKRKRVVSKIYLLESLQFE
jgi:hypothetical protein